MTVYEPFKPTPMPDAIDESIRNLSKQMQAFGGKTKEPKAKLDVEKAPSAKLGSPPYPESWLKARRSPVDTIWDKD